MVVYNSKIMFVYTDNYYYYYNNMIYKGKKVKHFYFSTVTAKLEGLYAGYWPIADWTYRLQNVTLI